MNGPFPLYAQIYVDIHASAVNKPFTYGVPDTMTTSLYLGAAVRVLFNHREIIGYVVDVTEFPPPVPRGVEIKPIREVIQGKSLWDNEMLDLAKWLEHYYSASFVSALKVLIPAPVRVTREGKVPQLGRVKKVVLTRDPEVELKTLDVTAPSQAAVIRYLLEYPGSHPMAEVVKQVDVSYAVLRGLEKKGLLSIHDDAPPLTVFHSYPATHTTPLTLTEDQKNAFSRLIELSHSDKAEVALLHGITGSGKTEVYLQVIEQVLKEGREALVLVPEISLTPQAIERFRGRFAEDVAVLHSRLTEAERRQMWWKIRDKGVRVVLGARSAVFAPLENIGVIVVDEEHESSYKQEKEPRYHARQVAVKRAMTHKALVILGSATPTMEVYHWAQEGKYHYLELPRRVGQSVLPEIRIVDLNKDFPKKKKGEESGHRERIIGETLRHELERILVCDEQAILFLNRRGFSSFLLCRDCGNVIRCPYCAITLTYHKVERLLKCHYCDYRRPAPDICPFCSGVRVKPVAWGIQKVEEEVGELFPGTPCIRMDRDTTTGRDAHYRILKEFSRKKASILIGTQMIAKGLDFPGVTLVGVILGDVSLYFPDFRALERTYQLLVQVAGRAGRRETPGNVIIQTYNPESPVYQAVVRQDYEGFFRWELDHRRELKYPPFSHVIHIVFSGENSEKIREHSLRFSELLKGKALRKIFYSVLGPAPCPLARIKSRYRWHVTLKGEHVLKMAALIRAAMSKCPAPSGIQVSVDVDPLNLM